MFYIYQLSLEALQTFLKLFQNLFGPVFGTVSGSLGLGEVQRET